MSLASALSAYVNINLLIGLGFLGVLIVSFHSSQNQLKFHYSILTIILFFSVLHPLIPHNDIFKPAAKVWSAQSIKSFGQEYSPADGGGYLSVPTLGGSSIINADQVTVTWVFLGTILFILGGIFISRDLMMLLKIKKKSYLIRKIGKVQIFLNDDIQVPFSYAGVRVAYIVIPSSLISQMEDFKMAVFHEIQHHRQNDTKWVYVMWFLKLICILNPALYMWNKKINEIQEFACDEALIGQGKVESQKYARCLVEVAQTAVNQKYIPACATGLMFLTEGSLLKRRIEKMFFKKSLPQTEGKVTVVAGLLLTSIMAATALASKSIIQDRRVSQAQAEAMAIKAQNNSDFPIVVNDLVLKQLNRYIGTPEGREFMRDALSRMKNYQGVIGETIRKYKVPVEIMAIPITESGYQNLPQRTGAVKSAGLWQFIPSTARNFGLKVNGVEDERLNVALSTDAALRYLLSNNLRFKNWHLSALAYNMGEMNVQKGMEALSSRDAWTLIRNGHEGDKDYLPKLMAAILIMKNPQTIE